MLEGGRRRRSVATNPPLFDDVLRIFDRAVEELSRGMSATGTGRSQVSSSSSNSSHCSNKHAAINVFF